MHFYFYILVLLATKENKMFYKSFFFQIESFFLWITTCILVQIGLHIDLIEFSFFLQIGTYAHFIPQYRRRRIRIKMEKKNKWVVAFCGGVVVIFCFCGWMAAEIRSCCCWWCWWGWRWWSFLLVIEPT